MKMPEDEAHERKDISKEFFGTLIQLACSAISKTKTRIGVVDILGPASSRSGSNFSGGKM